MHKNFCDICDKEIQQKEFAGGMMRLKDEYPIFPIPGSEGKNRPFIQKNRTEEVWDLCEECQTWLWGLAEEKKSKSKLKL